jgi:hypothetical protein
VSSDPYARWAGWLEAGVDPYDDAEEAEERRVDTLWDAYDEERDCG